MTDQPKNFFLSEDWAAILEDLRQTIRRSIRAHSHTSGATVSHRAMTLEMLRHDQDRFLSALDLHREEFIDLYWGSEDES